MTLTDEEIHFLSVADKVIGGKNYSAILRRLSHGPTRLRSDDFIYSPLDGTLTGAVHAGLIEIVETPNGISKAKTYRLSDQTIGDIRNVMRQIFEVNGGHKRLSEPQPTSLPTAFREECNEIVRKSLKFSGNEWRRILHAGFFATPKRAEEMGSDYYSRHNFSGIEVWAATPKFCKMRENACQNIAVEFAAREAKWQSILEKRHSADPGPKLARAPAKASLDSFVAKQLSPLDLSSDELETRTRLKKSELINRMRESGLTLKQIAAATGLSVSYVGTFIGRNRSASLAWPGDPIECVRDIRRREGRQAIGLLDHYLQAIAKAATSDRD